MSARTIFVVDDNAQFRDSVQWWLSGAGYEVVEFGDPDAALAGLRARPSLAGSCLLLDVRMPGMSGLDLHDRLNEQGLRLPVVYMTGHGDVALAVRAMQKGAVSMLEKPFAEQAMEQALRRAFDWWCAEPAPPKAPVVADDAPAQQWAARCASLTAREREVLHWVVQPTLNKTISDRMGISIKTVEMHRANLMRKLGAGSVTHLIKMVVAERVL
jgi:two-component system response regulator FixJ